MSPIGLNKSHYHIGDDCSVCSRTTRICADIVFARLALTSKITAPIAAAAGCADARNATEFRQIPATDEPVLLKYIGDALIEALHRVVVPGCF